MFGISMSELAVIGVVALIFVGPQRLPSLLRTLGEWVGKLRRLTTEVRAQTGIDELLREEGIDGVRELRALLRGEVGNRTWKGQSPTYEGGAEPSVSDEYPIEGADAGDALPDDLWAPDPPQAAAVADAGAVPRTPDAAEPDAAEPPRATESSAESPAPPLEVAPRPSEAEPPLEGAPRAETPIP